MCLPLTTRRYATIEVDDEGDLEGVVDYGDGCGKGDDYYSETVKPFTVERYDI